MLADYRITLPLQTPGTADARARALLEKACGQVGFISNMYANMGHP